jgi:hypothetical protein
LDSETYEIVLARRVHSQLEDAPPILRGYVAGMVAVLRVDPTAASGVFHTRRIGDAWTATFGAGLGASRSTGFCTERIVVLLDLTWAAD